MTTRTKADIAISAQRERSRLTMTHDYDWSRQWPMIGLTTGYFAVPSLFSNRRITYYPTIKTLAAVVVECHRPSHGIEHGVTRKYHTNSYDVPPSTTCSASLE